MAIRSLYIAWDRRRRKKFGAYFNDPTLDRVFDRVAGDHFDNVRDRLTNLLELTGIPALLWLVRAYWWAALVFIGLLWCFIQSPMAYTIASAAVFCGLGLFLPPGTPPDGPALVFYRDPRRRWRSYALWIPTLSALYAAAVWWVDGEGFHEARFAFLFAASFGFTWKVASLLTDQVRSRDTRNNDVRDGAATKTVDNAEPHLSDNVGRPEKVVQCEIVGPDPVPEGFGLVYFKRREKVTIFYSVPLNVTIRALIAISSWLRWPLISRVERALIKIYRLRGENLRLDRKLYKTPTRADSKHEAGDNSEG